MKHFFFLVFCIQNFVCTSQTFSGIIKYDASSFSPVEYASIINKNNQNYVFSDSMGKFSINAQVKDTLEISHLNAVKIKYIVGSKKSDTISVPQNINSLKEVAVNSQKNKKSKSNKKCWIGFSTSDNYAIKINVEDTKTTKSIKKIIFPIKFINKHSNLGIIKFQFVKTLDAMPFLKPITISVNEILKDDEIVLDLSNQTANELNSDFFIIIEQIIENRILKKNESLSVNPFFHANYNYSAEEGNLFKQYNQIQKQKWTSYSVHFLPKQQHNIDYNLVF